MKLIQRMALSAALSTLALVAQAIELPGSVVNTEWLAKNRSQVQVVEVRSDVASFKREADVQTDKKTGKKIVVEVGGHMVDSRLIDMKTMRTDRKVGDLTVRYMLPERADFERTIQAAGIDAGKPIIFVPVGQAIEDIDDALRVYWQFKMYGDNNVAVLDGGMAAWLLEGREASVAAVPAKQGSWKADKEQVQYLAESIDVAVASQRNEQIIDARSAGHFYGLSKRDYVYSYGHVAGAKLMSPDVFARNVQGVAYFHNAKTYASLLNAIGFDTNKPTITYCNSGHLAAGPWFVLSEIVGNKQTRLYDGSMHQWTLEKRPTVSVALN